MNESVNNNDKEIHIKEKIFAGFISILLLNGCSTMRESLILGAGSGMIVGGIAGNQIDGDKSENIIKGAVVGGVVFGLVSYFIHGALEKRDATVRRETLMNLEHYDVMGFDGVSSTTSESRSGKCSTTKEVDGRLVSIPCDLVNDSDEGKD